jgi:predicted O-methyltransferase YrrM
MADSNFKVNSKVYDTDLWCIRGHFNKNQADKLEELINEINPKFVLETGFCTGRSASCVLYYGKIEKMNSIDINLNYINPEGRIFKEKLEARYPSYKVIEGSSHKILNENFFRIEYPNGIDWATIDGDHSYEGALQDLYNISQYINQGGIIIIDDYYSGKPDGCHIPEVNKACDEFYEKNKAKFTKEQWNKSGKGFMILRKI